MLQFRADYKPTALKRHRVVGGNRMYDPSKKDKKDWLKCVIKYAPEKPFDYPLKVNVEFYFPRPKNHYRSGRYSEELKKNAPTIHSSMPDVDNLAKFVLDAMNGAFYNDDRQVVELNCHKEYTSKNSKGYTIVTIERYTEKSSHFTKTQLESSVDNKLKPLKPETKNDITDFFKSFPTTVTGS